MVKGDSGVVAGLMVAGKVTATGAPSAVVTDTALQFAPATWSNYTRELVRVGAGAVQTIGALLLGASPEWAAGPLVSNTGVAATQAGRLYGLADKIRARMPQPH